MCSQVALARRYVYWQDLSDERAVWRAEAACGGFARVPGVDLFRAKCDAGHLRVMLPASCCAMCNDKTAAALAEGAASG